MQECLSFVYLIVILIGLLVKSLLTAVAVRAASDRCDRPLATQRATWQPVDVCSIRLSLHHTAGALSVWVVSVIDVAIERASICWPSVVRRLEAVAMANRLLGGGQSNAAVVCIKLLLTVFNFIFWVSNRHSSIRVAVMPYVSVAECVAFWFRKRRR